MKRVAGLFCAGLALFGNRAYAGAETALQMKSYCEPIYNNSGVNSEGRLTNFPNTQEAWQCWGAFAAIQSLVVVVDSETHQELLRSCPAPDVTRLQMISIFVRYANNNPQLLNLPFAVVVMSSLSASFPCSK